MKIILLLCALFGSSCAKDISQPEAFEFSNGERWECYNYSQESCGMALKGCGPMKAQFDCVIDIRYIGKSIGMDADELNELRETSKRTDQQKALFEEILLENQSRSE